MIILIGDVYVSDNDVEVLATKCCGNSPSPFTDQSETRLGSRNSIRAEFEKHLNVFITRKN